MKIDIYRTKENFQDTQSTPRMAAAAKRRY